MAGDPSCPPRRAAGKEPADLSRPGISQLPILFGSPLTIPCSSPRSGVFISQTKSLGVGQRSFLDEDTLALVSLARTAEAHDNRAETTRFLRSPAQSRVSRRKKDEMVHVGAAQAEWAISFHEQQRTCSPADGARPCPVSYTHLRAHETPEHLVCRL